MAAPDPSIEIIEEKTGVVGGWGRTLAPADNSTCSSSHALFPQSRPVVRNFGRPFLEISGALFGGIRIVTPVNMPDDFEFGPKMRALTEKQRAFVMVLVEFPAFSHAEAARMAGYSDASDGAKVRACNLLQDKKIVEAVQEQAGKRLWAISLKAAARVDQLMDSPDESVALKAAGMVLDRTGLAAAQNININQTVSDQSGKAIMERIAALSQKLGVDAQRLLGQPAPVVVEAEFSEVGDDQKG